MTNSNNIDTRILKSSAPSQIESIEFLDLSPDYPKVNAFGHFIGLAIIFVILFTINLLVDKIHIHFLILAGTLFIALISGVYGYYFAKSCQYIRGEFELMYKQGLWWKKQTALSFSRIQHIDISHGPLERKYDLATIKFFTAGGAASDLKIPGLPSAQAELLRSEILQYAKNEFDGEPNHE